MKANELRIGNYVFDKNMTICSVWILEAGDDKFEGSINGRAANGDYDLDSEVEYSPIKLTEEWLLKFGFEKVGFNFEKEWLLLHVNKRTGTFDFLLNEPFSEKMHVTTLEYVHQLQNLYFALTGEELKKTKTSKTSNAEN